MPFLKCHLYKKPRSRVLEASAHKQGWRQTISNQSKDRYIGNWDLSQKNGFGRVITRTGRLYEGSWMKDYRHNFGTSGHQVNKDTKDSKNEIFTLEYRGDWKYGHYNGYGERYYDDHSVFKGYFKNSKRRGFGQMWYANGSYYEGDWSNDLRHGPGIFVEYNGNRYEGHWKHDLKHGRGRYFHLVSGQYQDGVWIKNICVTSIIADIPFRQTSKYPTKYTINEVQLVDEAYICEDLIADALLESTVDKPVVVGSSPVRVPVTEVSSSFKIQSGGTPVSVQ